MSAQIIIHNQAARVFIGRLHYSYIAHTLFSCTCILWRESGVGLALCHGRRYSYMEST